MSLGRWQNLPIAAFSGVNALGKAFPLTAWLCLLQNLQSALKESERLMQAGKYPVDTSRVCGNKKSVRGSLLRRVGADAPD